MLHPFATPPLKLRQERWRQKALGSKRMLRKNGSGVGEERHQPFHKQRHDVYRAVGLENKGMTHIARIHAITQSIRISSSLSSACHTHSSGARHRDTEAQRQRETEAQRQRETEGGGVGGQTRGGVEHNDGQILSESPRMEELLHCLYSTH